MNLIFWVLGAITVAGAVATVVLHKLIHAALGAVISFLGLALLYLSLDAQFVGFAQLMVYIGAVTILIIFAILLTQGKDMNATKRNHDHTFSPGAFWGLVVAALVFAVLGWAVTSSSGYYVTSGATKSVANVASVASIGRALSGDYVLPLEIVALILTSALIGAVVIAMSEKAAKPEKIEKTEKLVTL